MSHGLNRNIGYSITNMMYANKHIEYKAIVRSARSYQEFYVTQMKRTDLPRSISKHLIWLRLMGLAETRDMKIQ